MNLSVFDFKAYKDFINKWIQEQPKGGHGVKSLIAHHAQCNPAYVTLVLNGDAHFSLEQVEKLKGLLGLTHNDFDFFFLLVERDRAGTQSLRKYLTEKIEKILTERRQLKNRVKSQAPLSIEIQTKYFSSWVYSAIHTALTIPRMQDPRVIANQLKLEETTVREVIRYFIEVGIVVATKKGYEPGEVRIHLPHDSEHIFRHHANWRLQAMKAFDHKKEANLHYSSVMSISQDDFQEIREILLKAIENTKLKIRDSKEETLASIGVDFFKVSVD
nr:hypothetical protein HAGR004_41050 [Bdellovibrio sp. HAGR004]